MPLISFDGLFRGVKTILNSICETVQKWMAFTNKRDCYSRTAAPPRLCLDWSSLITSRITQPEWAIHHFKHTCKSGLVCIRLCLVWFSIRLNLANCHWLVLSVYFAASRQFWMSMSR